MRLGAETHAANDSTSPTPLARRSVSGEEKMSDKTPRERATSFPAGADDEQCRRRRRPCFGRAGHTCDGCRDGRLHFVPTSAADLRRYRDAYDRDWAWRHADVETLKVARIMVVSHSSSSHARTAVTACREHKHGRVLVGLVAGAILCQSKGENLGI
ncbi:hypothetical protein K3495_g5494 [Podosphaera aphanis]|nr:hypothetical protein K3495_g5494 [Podosphaera aphanis]